MGSLTGLLTNIAGGGAEEQRTPDTFKNLGSLGTIWTPAAGKRFRLMGGLITMTADSASALNDNQIFLRDGGVTVFQRYALFLPTTGLLTAVGSVLIPFVLPSDGYLSSTVNNALFVGISGVATGGTMAVNAWGTEE